MAKADRQFQAWWLSVNMSLPASRAALLAEARKLADFEAKLTQMREEHAAKLRALERYEDQREAYLAALGVDEL